MGGAVIDPLSTAATLGGKSASSRMGYHVGLQLASVLAPGIVIATEMYLLGMGLVTERDSARLGSLVEGLSDIHGSGLVLFALIGISIGYILGWISRDLGLRTLVLVERGRRVLKTHARRDMSKDLSAKASAAEVTWHQTTAADELSIKQRLRAVMGDQAVDDCIRRHPILAVFEKDAAHVQPGDTGQQQASLGHYHELEAFIYCKLWLRRFAPDLSVDWIEAEINMLGASVVPVALLEANLIAWSVHPGGAVLLSALPFLGIVTLLARVLARKRLTERWEATKNLVGDHMMRSALTSYSNPATASPGDGE